jgi:hypothetical protein
MRHSFTWCPELLEKVRDQRNYQQFVPEKTLSGYRETNQNLARKKRAKRMLAIWKKSPSTVRLMDGTVANATNAGTKGANQTQSRDRRSVSPKRSASPPKAKR